MGSRKQHCRTRSPSCRPDVHLPDGTVCRECGLAAELEAVPVQSLVPEPLRGIESADEFLRQLPEHDGAIQNLLEEAEAAGECLRFVGEDLAAAKLRFISGHTHHHAYLPSLECLRHALCRP